MKNDDQCETCGLVDCPGAPRFKGICPQTLDRRSVTWFVTYRKEDHLVEREFANEKEAWDFLLACCALYHDYEPQVRRSERLLRRSS